MVEPVLQFEIHPSSGVPIYRQVMDQVRALVASKQLKTGDMLPSVRQLAAQLEVNMMTISKAYARLEAEGLLERVRGTGMRLSMTPASGTVAERKQQLRELADPMVNRGLQLGLIQSQIISVVKESIEERRSCPTP